jgi:hypothetical protein
MRMTRHAPQPGTAFTNLAADPLACTLYISGTYPCAASKMRCGWELTNICPQLCDETPSRHTINPGNRYPAIQCVRQLWVLMSEFDRVERLTTQFQFR